MHKLNKHTAPLGSQPPFQPLGYGSGGGGGPHPTGPVPPHPGPPCLGGGGGPGRQSVGSTAHPRTIGSLAARSPSSAFCASVGGRRPVPTSSASSSENDTGNAVPAMVSSISRDRVSPSAGGPAAFGRCAIRSRWCSVHSST